MLKFDAITKDFTTEHNTINVLKGLSLQFRECEFVSILGPSGCGKTTLLNIVGGLDHPTSGGVIIDGRSTTDYNDLDWNDYRNKRIGFVFQSYNLIPHLTVLKNVELSLTLAGINKEERKLRAMEAIEKVGLADQARKHPLQMSGGQMQRVAIARALVNNPQVILADEPTGALDSESGESVMKILKEVAKDRLVIMVTHNRQLAEEYSTRIITMADGIITSDSNPYPDDEYQKDEGVLASRKKTAENAKIAELSSDRKYAKRAYKKYLRKQRKKTSLSPATAISLSLTNLFSKKGRTFLTSFAGSIGIIGIMLVLSLSAGARAYILTKEEDALSQYPIQINETNTDLSAVLSLLSDNNSGRADYPDTQTLYTNKVMGNLLENLDVLVSTNDLASLKQYIDQNFDKSTGTVKYNYGVNFDVFCNYAHSSSEENMYMKTQPFLEALEDIEYLNEMMDTIGKFASYLSLWDQLSDDSALLNQQYDLLGDSRWPSSYNEAVLVVDEKNQLDDFTLFALGLKSKDDIIAALTDPDTFSNSTFTVSDILQNLKYRVCTQSDYYYTDNDGATWQNVSDRTQQRSASFVEGQLTEGRDNTVEINVVGVVRPKEGVTVTSINGNIGYSSKLIEYLSGRAETSPIGIAQSNNTEINIVTGEDLTSLDKYYKLLRSLGIADMSVPSSIQIFANSFEDKDAIVAFINQYNEESGNTVKYSDKLAMIMSYVDNMTSTITGVLIGFAAISLIVSSIMIAIIIYTSVLERRKEIGVLRSIGARKLDVSGVFIAESGIIGVLSGVIGTAIAYLLMLPINAVLDNLFNVSDIASPLWWHPLLMLGISIVLAVVAGFVPARIAANKDPVECLRTE